VPRDFDLLAPFNLDELQVANPCPANWADMVGSDRVRFCASCQKNVFNLSGMGREEATELVRGAEGRLCVRFFRRTDGTILTEDCPVGMRLALKRAKRATLMAAASSIAAITALLAVLGQGVLFKKTCQSLVQVRTTIVERIAPGPDVLGERVSESPPEPVVGDVAPVRVKEIKGDVALPVETNGNVAPPRETLGRMKVLDVR
jgi:hypothetical protein